MMRPHQRRTGTPQPITDDELSNLVPPSPDLLEVLSRKFPVELPTIPNTAEVVLGEVARMQGQQDVIAFLFNLANKEF